MQLISAQPLMQRADEKVLVVPWHRFGVGGQLEIQSHVASLFVCCCCRFFATIGALNVALPSVMRSSFH